MRRRLFSIPCSTSSGGFALRSSTARLLESKIKRLKEERARSLTEETDLQGRALEKGETRPSPATITGKLFAGDEPNGRSSDESVPTEHNPELAMASRDAENDAVNERKSASKNEPEGKTGTIPINPLTEPVRDRGSSPRFTRNTDNGEDKGDGGEAGAAVTRAGPLGESGELSESKRDAASSSKQSSDVQSLAILSRRKCRRVPGRGTSSDEEEVDKEEISPAATKKISAVKPPESMVNLLRRIRSHRLGSAFERRLRIQESDRYRRVIKQHMDLRTVKSRLDRGAYSEDSRKFYRDLLLLFNNTIVFYRRTSTEHAAAVELRALVTKEMKLRLRYRSLNPKTSKPFIAPCGKSSSVKKKPENREVNRGNGSLAAGLKGKKEISSNHSNQSNNKKGNHTNEKTKKNEFGKNEISSNDAPMIKSVDVKKKEVRKKEGAEKFLRRMKQDSSTESDEEEEEEEVKEMNKKTKNKKKATTSCTGGRVKEENMKGKKTAGKVAGKRGRESKGEGSGGGGRGRKRTRR
ncbi:PREDICTED: bromodomain-containing protein bet-1-like isoform X2 [Tarenaya hassleriana]|uniref:bromodomain-containing protein bet-1-like isoform X2 n=1 Tax=Tarenaya hassleriana TaxID=28532 RepID=UPI00053C3331|nr:PREDICTED: bromodomain-containing protein bet-1-like isoform X2 [Tarenaya hassleriana]